MNAKRIILLVFLALFIVTPSVQAVPLSLDYVVEGHIPGASESNDGLLPVYGTSENRDGYYGARVKLTGNAALTFDFLGFEAAWDNEFRWNGVTLFANDADDSEKWIGPDARPLASASYQYDGGTGTYLPFSFYIPNSNSAYINKDNNTAYDNDNPNFFVSWDNDNLGNSLVLWFDDGGGAGGVDDDNHDDMAIRITARAQPVPEPATMFLLGTGLFGLAGIGRKKFIKK